MHVFKKMVALLLLAVMVLSLCACGKEKDKGNGGSGENSALSGKFSAGFGKVDITPKENVPLDSYGDAEHRISTGLLSYMYALAVAVTDTDGNSLIFVVGDQSWCSPSLQGQIRTEITNRTGVPGDHIVLSGTHTHAAPAPGLTENPAQARYNVQYTKGMVDAAVMAMEDRKPAKVYAGGVDTEKMNFVRRYIMDDGSLTGDNAVGTGTKIERHETIADPELQLLKFVREGGKDIVIGNFQAHPHLEGYRKELSSQTVGAFREAMEKVADVHCMHWQGAAGNLNSHSRMDENIFEQSPEGRKKYGEKMAEYAMSVYNDLEEVKTGPVRVISKIYEGKVNHEWDSKADVAQKIVDTWKSTNNKNKAMALAGDSKIGSVYHANRIVGNSKKARPRICISLPALLAMWALSLCATKCSTPTVCMLRKKAPLKGLSSSATLLPAMAAAPRAISPLLWVGRTVAMRPTTLYMSAVPVRSWHSAMWICLPSCTMQNEILNCRPVERRGGFDWIDKDREEWYNLTINSREGMT